MKARTLIIMGVITIAGVTAIVWLSGGASAARRGLDFYVKDVAGADATDCGRIRFPRSGPRVWSAAQSAEVATCMAGARAGRRAFYFSAGGRELDSEVFTGLIGASDGTIVRFSYDSAPCGGPNCGERFQRRGCPIASTTDVIDPTTFCM